MTEPVVEVDSEEFLLKIVIIGDSNVGKTKIVGRFIRGEFLPDSRNTIGVDFSLATANVKGRETKIQFWDTAGQEKFRAMVTAYYRNAQAAILVYDLTNRLTFDHLNKWLNELRSNSAPKTKILLLGNKKDLEEDRQVSTEEGESFAKKKGCFFMEVSAKDDDDKSVSKAFNILLEEMVENQDELYESTRETRETGKLRQLALKEASQNKSYPYKKKKKCCR